MNFGKIIVYKRNLFRIMFTEEDFKKTFVNWSSAAQGMVARFRSAYGEYIDPWIKELVNELKSDSKEFNLWWSMYNAQIEEEHLKTVIHPVLERLEFEETSYMVWDNTGLKMSIFTPLAET
jgi:hypothetical protein